MKGRITLNLLLASGLLLALGASGSAAGISGWSTRSHGIYGLSGGTANTAPTASFTIEPAAGFVGTVFTFDASGSSDAESALYELSIRFDWENDGFFDVAWWNASQTMEHIYDTTGQKTIAMIIKDPEGLTDITTRTLQVDDPGNNTPPTARCAGTPAEGTISTIFTFDASGSSDRQDSAAALMARWDWHNDGFWDTPWLPITEPQQRQFDRHGLQTVRLRVRDSGTLSHNTTCTVEVTTGQPNTPPTASFTVTPAGGNVLTVFTLDASGCVDVEDALEWLQVRFDWQDDGVFDTGWSNASQTLQHRFTVPGSTTIRMEVRDTGGLTDATTRTLQVDALAVYLPLMLRQAIN